MPFFVSLAFMSRASIDRLLLLPSFYFHSEKRKLMLPNCHFNTWWTRATSLNISLYHTTSQSPGLMEPGARRGKYFFVAIGQRHTGMALIGL